MKAPDGCGIQTRDFVRTGSTHQKIYEKPTLTKRETLSAVIAMASAPIN